MLTERLGGFKRKVLRRMSGEIKGNENWRQPYNKVVMLLSGDLQGGSNMTGTDLCVNKPHCAAAVRP